ncbi:hypothetical protein P261_02723 [Lachnospiraceae bacterium TWA4]|nr:hypothetical protein P261_02723 [Lachnospiraceae bacterium TWA4]
MIKKLAGENGSSKNYVIVSGGSNLENYMHLTRTIGMLETLESDYGFKFDKDIKTVASQNEVGIIGTSSEGGSVLIYPGYFRNNIDEFKQALEGKDVDAVATVIPASDFMEAITAHETTQNKDIEVGTIDCFGETNKELFETKDSFGNSKLNFLAGKEGAMGAPAFVGLLNSITGHEDVFREDGNAYNLHQNFVYADSIEQFNEIKTQSESIYKNAYSTDEIMNVLSVYNSSTNFDTFKKFAEKDLY